MALANNSPAEAKTEPTNGVKGTTKEDIAQADVAAQVADTAEKLDEGKPAAV